jgi:hypothetical protein
MVYSPEYVVDRLLIPLNQATTARSAQARAQFNRGDFILTGDHHLTAWQ